LNLTLSIGKTTKTEKVDNSGKENSPADSSHSSQMDENSDPTSSDQNLLEGAADNFSSVLTERRQVRYENEDDSSDSDEENEEETDEKENARNKLKALLASSKPKPKTKPQPAVKKSVSTSENDNNTDFLHQIQKMKSDLFHKLEIPVTEEDEEDSEVSKIFYEGREGQEFTMKVLEKFFEDLNRNANQFVHQLDTPEKQSKKQHQTHSEEPALKEKIDSDKERIRKKLSSTTESSKGPTDSNKESLKSLLGAPAKAKKTPITDINDAIKVDSQVLNYGVVSPGKLLGSIFVVANISDSEQTIEVTIDSSVEVYDREEITKNKEFEFLNEITSEEIDLSDKENEELSTETKKQEALESKRRFIPNSECTNDCWYIENPRSKDLTKKITLKLGPK
jgi:hypothetical protein